MNLVLTFAMIAYSMRILVELFAINAKEALSLMMLAANVFSQNVKKENSAESL